MQFGRRWREIDSRRYVVSPPHGRATLPLSKRGEAAAASLPRCVPFLPDPGQPKTRPAESVDVELGRSDPARRALPKLVTGDTARCRSGCVAALRGRRVVVTDQVAADGVRVNLGGVRIPARSNPVRRTGSRSGRSPTASGAQHSRSWTDPRSRRRYRG